MKITFAGTGSAFCMGADNFQSNMVLEVPVAKTGKARPQRLLIDCGSDARHSLRRMGLAPNDLDAIYISHLHSDHIGGLEWVALSNYFLCGGHRTSLYAMQELLEPLWEHSLRGGLEISDQGNSTLATYFDVHALAADSGFDFHGVAMTIVPCEHVVTPQGVMLSYGLFGDCGSKRFFLTTDARFSPEIHMPYYRKADIIFQDCELGPRHSGVHAHYDQIRTLPDDIKNKMWLYHYQAYDQPDAKADGFCGFVQPRQSFDLT
ncbi:MBL fold metallo-hydrolase [Thalassospira sp.]|uniref:MBL fold metallo-hydrolase n=1 Tax=Thalassospira sp. TaxID=1912094 RepID=UPI0027357A93|nr:MBL fold metallo-hydrolase [Thalassospira sp.]MDP2696519.1 MBL fold metallo-hydrolase [Thalassospira sp.]